MTNSETKTCPNCKTEFRIEPDDFSFYKKIKVPPPTWCPECRMQRRLNFRNERTLHKRKCDLCGKNIIAMYPSGTPFPVYCTDCFNSDKWEALSYGMDFNKNVPFLEQFKKLQNKVPRPQNVSYRLIQSDYTNCTGDLKNCYLIFGSQRDENCYYSHYLNGSRNCMDVLYCMDSEECYECFDIEQCFNVRFSESCVQCRDSMFLFDCRNCSECIGCVGLRNKSYHILNQPYSKEDYLSKKNKLNLHTRQGIANFYARYLNELYYKLPRKFYHGTMNKDFSGDYVSNSEKTFKAFYTQNARNTKFSFWNIHSLDVYDYFAWGDVELSYETVSVGENAYHCRFSMNCWDSVRDLEYCDHCFSSSDLFGCIALRHKKYCILNKQYSKERFLELRGEIINEMNKNPYVDAKGRVYKYGEFFPIELSPFSYNDTVAQEHFPLSREQALSERYKFRDFEERTYIPTMSGKDLPEVINEVKDAITDEIISCALYEKKPEQAKMHNCTVAFKIIPEELEFYRTENLPLPTKCPNRRHYQRIGQRNPLKLWHRKCACVGEKSDNGIYQNQNIHFHGSNFCSNEFETSYASERREIVYCEQCFQNEIL